MVVIPNEFLNRTAASFEGKERADMEAFVIEGAKEALDFAIRLRCVRSQDEVANPKRGANLLKPSQPVRMKGMPHGKGKRVVGEDGLDAIRQGGDDVLEKRGGHRAGWSV